MAIIQCKHKTGTDNKQSLRNFHEAAHKLSGMFSCMSSREKKNLWAFPNPIIKKATKCCLCNLQPNFTLFSEFMLRDDIITFSWCLLLLIVYNHNYKRIIYVSLSPHTHAGRHQIETTKWYPWRTSKAKIKSNWTMKYNWISFCLEKVFRILT